LELVNALKGRASLLTSITDKLTPVLCLQISAQNKCCIDRKAFILSRYLESSALVLAFGLSKRRALESILCSTLYILVSHVQDVNKLYK